jgi:hypothetical protein
MNRKLKSHIAEPLGRSLEEATKEEVERVKKCKDVLDEIQKMMARQNIPM